MNAPEQGYRRKRRGIVLAWIALLAFLTLSAACARLRVGGAHNLLVSLGIAAVKIAIVGWVFMGLREHRPLLRLAAATGGLALCVMGLLGGVDLSTRTADPADWQIPALVQRLSLGRR